MKREIFCVACHQDVAAVKVTGKEIYPHRRDLWAKTIWQCPDCKNYVGTHGGSLNPLGCIPTKSLRDARMALHAKMDPLWKEGWMKRGELYRMIAERLGIAEFHNGETRSVKEVEAASAIVDEIIGEVVGQEARKVDHP